MSSNPRPRGLLRAATARVKARTARLFRAFTEPNRPLPLITEHALDGFGVMNTYIPATRSDKQHAARRGSYRPLAKHQLRQETNHAE